MADDVSAKQRLPLFCAGHTGLPLAVGDAVEGEIVDGESDNEPDGLIDRSAFGFDAEVVEADEDLPAEAIPMEVRPIPKRYAMAAAASLALVALFVGRNLSGSGPAASMASIGSAEAVTDTEKTVARQPGRTYLLFGAYADRAAAEGTVLELWTLGVEATVERDLPSTGERFTVVSADGFVLMNGVPRGLRGVLPALRQRDIEVLPYYWSKPLTGRSSR